MIGGVETGGTKIVCAVAESPDEPLEREVIPTTADPAQDLGLVADFFARAAQNHGVPEALGFASFGPCDVHTASPTWGYMAETPKPGWAGVDVVGSLWQAFAARGLPEIPVGFETDVGAAALGELRAGAGVGLHSMVYITVGTGVGAGIVEAGRIVHGLVHPEAGHVLVPLSPNENPEFTSVCPYHSSCLEGLASGPAIAARWGVPGQDLPPDHEAWTLEAEYLAWGFHQLVCVVSPERIVVGGGVGLAGDLLERVRPRLLASLNGYVAAPQLTADAQDYVVPAALGGDAGIVGALLLAADMIEE